MKHAIAMFTLFFFPAKVPYQIFICLFSRASPRLCQALSYWKANKELNTAQLRKCRCCVHCPCGSAPRLCLNNDTGDRRSKKGQANPYLHIQTHSKRLRSSGSQDCLVLGMAHM